MARLVIKPRRHPRIRYLLIGVFCICILGGASFLYMRERRDATAIDLTPVPARWADSLVDSIGINTHLTYSTHNAQFDDYKKDPSKPAISLVCKGYDAEKNTCSDIDEDFSSNLYSTSSTSNGKTNWYLNYGLLRSIKPDLVTANNPVFTKMAAALFDAGIRHIRDSNDYYESIGLDNYVDRLYKLQHPSDTSKAPVTPSFVTNSQIGNVGGRYTTYCANGGLKVPGTSTYAPIEGYSLCGSKTPQEQYAACVRDRIDAEQKGGPIPACTLIEDTTELSRLTTYDPVKNMFVRKADATLAGSAIAVDSIEMQNEYDLAGNWAEQYGVILPWYPPNADGTRKTRSLSLWYENLTRTRGTNWFDWLETVVNTVRSTISRTSRAGEVSVPIIAPSLSMVSLYASPQYTVTRAQIDAALSATVLMNQGCANPIVEPKLQAACDSAFQNQLINQGNPNAAALVAATKRVFETTDINNAHVYCRQDWAGMCIRDDLIGNGRINWIGSGIQITRTLLSDTTKPFYITEWGFSTMQKPKASAPLTVNDLTVRTLNPNYMNTYNIANDDQGRFWELVQNKYIQRGIFDYFDASIARSYIYELKDDKMASSTIQTMPLDFATDFSFSIEGSSDRITCGGANPPAACAAFRAAITSPSDPNKKLMLNDQSEQQSRFGIIHDDFTPKPVFNTIKNITTLLSDRTPLANEGQQPESVSMALEKRTAVPVIDERKTDGSLISKDGRPEKIEKTLLQKHDGRIYLVLRNGEPGQLNSDYAQTIVNDVVNPVHLTLAKSGIRTVNVYDPGNYYTNSGTDRAKPIYTASTTTPYSNTTPNAIVAGYSKDAATINLDLGIPDRVIILELIPDSYVEPTPVPLSVDFSLLLSGRISGGTILDQTDSVAIELQTSNAQPLTPPVTCTSNTSATGHVVLSTDTACGTVVSYLLAHPGVSFRLRFHPAGYIAQSVAVDSHTLEVTNQKFASSFRPGSFSGDGSRVALGDFAMLAAYYNGGPAGQGITAAFGSRPRASLLSEFASLSQNYNGSR